MYNLKIVISGKSVEIWKHSVPIVRKKKKLKSDSDLSEEISEYEKAKRLKARSRYYEKKRWEVKRIIDANFSDFDTCKFLTLTFRNNDDFDITSVEDCNKEFKKFILRLRRYINKKYQLSIRYLCTNEVQKNRGAVHYHLILFGFPYVDNNILSRIWGLGYIKINEIKGIDSDLNVGRYISKYFSKDLDLKEKNKKAFFTSQNLKRPEEQFYYVKELDVPKNSYYKNYSIQRYDYQDRVIEDNVEYYVLDLDDFEKMKIF